ncbi:hypothetical protein [Youngiibacter multivorans]|uniref:Uncharacterized protein n=1 Tax=Youngiibacter multivorans TaxID=937251 RepID=A0ABS4G8R2_9CLOT|nr:hypothetical protein [Youngiibacter multivorans]MBP1920958.1 hypothetical protein [Youngiibacter multivorans]
MGDYQLRARIPQETADKLFKIMQELQEKTEGADVTLSSVTRQAVDNYIKSKEGDFLSIGVNRLTSNDLKDIGEYLTNDRGRMSAFSNESKRFMLMLSLELDGIRTKKWDRENPGFMDSMKSEGLDKMTLDEMKALNNSLQETLNKANETP